MDAPEEEAGLPEVIPSEEQAAQLDGFASEEEVGWPELVTPEADAGQP